MEVTITQFDSKYRNYFYSLNAEWLNTYYFVTDEDKLLLLHPEKIIAKGGEIFFALFKDVVLGTCALIPDGEKVYELIKMGVSPTAQGKGIGTMLMTSCIEFAKKKNAKLITLETAVPLKAAIHLYEKFGFIKTSEEYTHPVFNRVTFRMELKVE